MADEGLSFRDISRQLNVAKATVVQTLKRGGYDKKTSPSCLSKSWTGVVPYGYVVVQGRLVADPKEQYVIRLMKNYRQKGMGYREIAGVLAKHGLITRKGCDWKHQTVRAILLRQNSDRRANNLGQVSENECLPNRVGLKRLVGKTESQKIGYD